MNAKRAKYVATATLTKAQVDGQVPVLIHDPSAGPGEPQFFYATADEAEAAVASLANRQQQQQHQHQLHDAHQHHLQQEELHHDAVTLSQAQEVIIDEHGRAVTIQQLVTDEGNTVEEVQTVEESDGTHTILHIVDGDGAGGSVGVVDVHGELVEGDDEEHDPSLSPRVVEHEEHADGVCDEEGVLGGRDRKTFYCPNCGNCYSAAGSLKLHMRACMRQREEVPADERKCEICNKVFNSVSYLKEHMMRHTGEGPRRCTRCYRKFVDEDKWKTHMEAHKQQDKLDAEAEALAEAHGGKKVIVKEFNCSFCSQNFTVVFDAGQVKRRYACDTCREKFSNVEQLKQHKQQVDDKREFPCERCGRKFVFEGFLQRHLPTCDGTIKRRRDLK